MAGYYAAVRDGDPITEATVHATEDCPELRESSLSPRPIRQGMVDAADPDRCAECTGNGGDSSDGGDDELSGTCSVEKSDGDVCGRERPCPYHDRD